MNINIFTLPSRKRVRKKNLCPFPNCVLAK